MSESEFKTRKTRIDAKLRALDPAWEIIPYRDNLDLTRLRRHAVEEFPTENGPADYALFVKGRPLGILEAKKVAVDPQNALEQAKRYAEGIPASLAVGTWGKRRVPFLYASNGEVIWFLDARQPENLSRRISGFHSSDALDLFFASDVNAARTWMASNEPTRITQLRPYQVEAVQAVERELLKGRRELLVAMATGTGKTLVTVAQIHRLLESRFARRILFLVDRRSLAAQAVTTFNAFDTPRGQKFTAEYEVFSQRFRREDIEGDAFDPQVLPSAYLTHPSSAHAFVYVSTIQRMAINLFGAESGAEQDPNDPFYIEDDAERLSIPNHAFDLIIADECHRGYASKQTSLWRDTLNHFDAVKIGLTATPASHTTLLFGKPVYRYGIQQAVADGFLCDWETVVVRSDIRLNGVFLREGETVGLIDPETGAQTYDELEDEREFDAEDIEDKLTAPDSNRKIIEEIAQYAYRHEEETGRFPKILIFADNDIPHRSHADRLVNICRAVFGQGDDFVKKITGNANVDRPLRRIREFRNRPNPKIVVSVDMLATGVDFPELEFIVFLRPVKSRILWEQMLGRGTRRCDDISKTHFTIFDCFNGALIQRFRNATEFNVEPPQKDPTPLPKVVENICRNVDRAYHVKLLVKRLRRIEKDMTGKAREDFARFIPDGDIGAFAAKVPKLIEADCTATLKLLRDPAFQDLLLTYDRAKSRFVVAYEAEDSVSSQRVFGKFAKPEDYLEAFARFVRDKADEIAALKILLERPREWRTEALNELRRELKENEFSEKELSEAHREVHDTLADIISTVKRAARETEPLLTAERRAARAVEMVSEGKDLTDDQRLWLSLIREHLTRNLTLDAEDFETMAIFTNRGGLGRAKRIFGAELPKLIEELNRAIAA